MVYVVVFVVFFSAAVVIRCKPSCILHVMLRSTHRNIQIINRMPVCCATKRSKLPRNLLSTQRRIQTQHHIHVTFVDKTVSSYQNMCVIIKRAPNVAKNANFLEFLSFLLGKYLL
jgi:hypothetical protein